MARIPINADKKSVRTSVMLSEDVHLQVQALANANQVSSAWIIRMAVQCFLNEHHGKSQLLLRRSTRQGSESQ